jgi:hypothetical protein
VLAVAFVGTTLKRLSVNFSPENRYTQGAPYISGVDDPRLKCEGKDGGN